VVPGGSAALQDALEEADAEAVPRAGPRPFRRDTPQSSYTDPLRPLQADVRVRLGRESGAAMLALGSGSSEAAALALASRFKLVAGARNQRFLRLAERVIPKLAA